MFTVNEIREKYLKFFEKRGCKIIKSSSLVPDDPTLLFTNAGMVQFKNYYKGIEIPKFTKATTVQKCVRAGGKHNDLDNVGYTARHHTFFEMLGNFSFGDYFKKEAINWAWEFLTKILGLPKEKLCATIYYEDEEAFEIWHKIVGLPKEKIVRLKENFWEMGNTGPCGPCSEIFYDHGPEVEGGMPGTPEEDGDRYIEIWNLVFTQFNRNEKGELEELPKKNIDTGMGLERIAAVLQGVHNNFEIDLFEKLINNSKNIIGDGDIFAHRIIADHLRSSSFLIADGVLPSNEGRGYVLRRIMRRAMLQIHKLGCKNVAMYRLVPCLVDLMGDAYPELIEKEEFIMENMKIEEDRFRATLDKGLKRLEDKIQKVENNTLDGKDAFELYDTYGFPLDLTEILLKDKNIAVDIEGFDEEMKKQKERAKANWVGSGDKAINEIYLKINENTNFEGYDKLICNGKIIKIIKNNEFVSEVKEGDEIELVTDNTCFYGEMGGQVGDTGIIMLTKQNVPVLPFCAIQVKNTIKVNGCIIHQGIVEIGNFKVGDEVNLGVNKNRRKQISANHSATHLMHYALRKLLGNTLTQKGSMVDEKRLRFDVSYNGVIEPEILKNVEELVNNLIIDNTEVKTEIMNIEDAKKTGAMALFNEKYGDKVRVVEMGLNKSDEEKKYCSMELCGGTHIKRTGDIGFFKIVKEESIASGVRRIEAITGIEALRFINEKISIVNALSENLKVNSDALIEKIILLQKENKDLKKQLNDLEKSKLNNLQFEEKNVKDFRLAYKILENVSPQDLKQVIVTWQNTKYKENTIVATIVRNGDKNTIIVAVSKNLVDKYNAVELLKKFGGKGGGVATFAMGSIDVVVNDFKKIF